MFLCQRTARCEANTLCLGTIAVQLRMKIRKIQGFDNNFF